MTDSNSTSQTTNPDDGWKPKERPQSLIAQQFSAALDDLFKLNGIGALETSVEQKKEEVHYQRYQLEDLDARLRETSERLRKLEAKSRRQSQLIKQQRSPVHAQFAPGADEDSSGESDGQGSSPRQEEQDKRISR